MMKPASMLGREWEDASSDEVAILTRMWLEGASFEEIGAALGRTAMAVQTYACRKKMPRRTKGGKDRERRGQRYDYSTASIRPCMCCRKDFFSVHKGNRLCEACNESA